MEYTLFNSALVLRHAWRGNPDINMGTEIKIVRLYHIEISIEIQLRNNDPYLRFLKLSEICKHISP